MNFRHGSLESIILNALWELESAGVYKNSVKDVFDYICACQTTKRAYTTVKTVMDRLHEKEVLLRIKQGKKFYYRTAYSNTDIIINSLKKIAIQYCNSDMNKLICVAKSIANEDISEQKINIG
ncbi:MAG: BlaI/MecI/CopY family transcriptional regulator [Candidatus Gastranaerophilales bacterium]|nr:BlaI/MecI/CopY family transcriptional regulator [Candidatus Gastranaerophilales bacterium]